MEITPRIRQILQFLLDNTDYIREYELAKAIGSSKRTVQRELQYIGRELRLHQLALIKKKGVGLQLAGSDNAKKALREGLDMKQAYGFATKAERQQRLLLELLHDRAPKKIYAYSKLLNVSEATVSADMEDISPWLMENHLSLLKKPGYGVVLIGSEADYREALGRFIHTFATPLRSAYKVPSIKIYDFLNSDTICRVKRLLEKFNYSRLMQFTEESYMGLVVHIVIGIERVQQGAVTDNNMDVLDLANDEDRELAQSILVSIEEEFCLKMPEAELSYLLLHIKGAKIGYHNDMGDVSLDGPNETDIFNIIDRMIVAFDKNAAPQLRLDEELLHGLYIHLKPTLVRLQNHLSIVNPLLSDIKREYAEIFQHTIRAAEVITQTYGFIVEDDEISYLAIHFLAAIERIRGKSTGQTRIVQIGVVCASGFGLARLMLVKLHNKLGSSVELHAYGQKDLTPEIIRQMDFFLSSMSFEASADILQISPLINAEDIVRIKEKIMVYEHVHKKTMVDDSCFTKSLNRTERAAAAIQEILTGYDNISVRADTTFNELLDILSAKVTRCAKDALELAALLHRREMINSQIFPAQGFALLHGITNAVDKPIFLTAVPVHGAFAAPEFNGIHIAILMVIPESGDQWLLKEIMGAVSTSLVTDERLMAALEQGSAVLIQQHLFRILRNYFQTMIRQFI